MSAAGTARYHARTFDVQMSFGKMLRCPTMGALSLRSRNVEGKYSVQLTCSGVAVQMRVSFGLHFGSPVGPNRSVLIFSRRLPVILRRSATPSTKPVGPQM
jgi:hypothetical protein